jgi:hypothetical protein
MAGMVDSGDGRILSGGLKMALNTKQIVTTSFDSSWYCYGCAFHNIRPAMRTRGEVGGSPRQAIVLSDQNFPAMLPVSGNALCFKIIRIESGPISALVDMLLDLVGNRVVPAGSVILIGSVTHLADVGLSAYVSDMLEAEKKMRERLGRDLRVVPLPPMLMSGVDSGVLIREQFEFYTWAETFFPADSYLDESIASALAIIRSTCDGNQTWLEPKRVRLPAHTPSGATTWHSGGSTVVNTNTGPLPYGATALQQPEERETVTTMIHEIREKLAVDLDPSPAFERGRGGGARQAEAVDRFRCSGQKQRQKAVQSP